MINLLKKMTDVIKNILYTKNQKKILQSALEPPSKEWLWLRPKDGRVTLYDFINGKWTPVTAEVITPDVKPADDYSTDIKELYRSVAQIRTEIADFDVDLSGYYTKSQTYSKAEIDLKIGLIAPVDMSNYYTKSQTNARIEEAIDGIDVQDGLTPHINQSNHHWMIGDTDTEVNAESVGIQSIVYTPSSESGGTNVLTITLTNNTVYTCNILNGIDGEGGGGGGSTTVTINATADITEIGGGNFQEATAHAALHPDTMFQWILQDEDSQGNEFKKLIWHIGGGVFIDALGTVIEQ